MNTQRNDRIDDATERPRSLFVLSLPRSLSTLIYHGACLSLDFQQPSWTSDGELLNLDRFALPAEESRQPGNKYTQQCDRPELFAELGHFLDRSVVPAGFAYKDVVHPFATAAWLADKPYAMLKIQRDPAEVAMSMLAKGWHYPAEAAADGRALEAAVVEGLLRAWTVISALPGPTIQYDALIDDERELHEALAVLYPDVPLRQVRFIDSAFRNERDGLIARRSAPMYRRLADLVARIATELRASPPRPLTEGDTYADTHQAVSMMA